MARITSPGQSLLRAQQEAIGNGQRLRAFNLNPVAKGVPSLPVLDSIVEATARLTIEGASTLTVVVHDPDWLIEESGVLASPTGRLRAVDVTVDSLRFRLAAAQRESPDQLTMVFEDQVVAYMRARSKPISASRGSVTRAQFIERMVREIKARDIPFYSPEKGGRPRIEAPDLPDPTPAGNETGFDGGTRFEVKGQRADIDQMQNAATVLALCEQYNAGPKATKATVAACIVESQFRNLDYGDRDSIGILQLRVGLHGRRDASSVTRSVTKFLRQGFTGRGGAIAVAKANPGFTAGQVAQAVQGSAFPDRYDEFGDEADKIIAAYRGDGATEPATRTTYEQYKFTRGQDGNRENSWEAALRLADEVRWRLYAMGGVIVYATDDWLISKPASLVLDGPNAQGLLEPPTYRWDTGMVAGDVQISAVANRWAVRPGDVVALQKMGPISGRWLVETVEIDLLDPTETVVDLIKPMPARPEPAPNSRVLSTDADTDDADGDTPAGGGGEAAVKWARSKLGRYGETWGQNTGAELNKLQQEFGMQGQPWCAMFATTAAVQGGASRDVRTAAVAQIRQWTLEGSHGYEKGFRQTAKPGDLLCVSDNSHVILVAKVSGQRIDCIQGNGSAGKVDERSVTYGYGDICRPKYPVGS